MPLTIMKINYQILQSYDLFDLEKLVDEKSEKGFHPLGGVSITQHGNETLYAQSIIKKEHSNYFNPFKDLPIW